MRVGRADLSPPPSRRTPPPVRAALQSEATHNPLQARWGRSTIVGFCLLLSHDKSRSPSGETFLTSPSFASQMPPPLKRGGLKWRCACRRGRAQRPSPTIRRAGVVAPYASKPRPKPPPHLPWHKHFVRFSYMQFLLQILKQFNELNSTKTYVIHRWTFV